MVTIVDYKTYLREDGTEFHALVVQGEIEMVTSKETGRVYITARSANVACTFDENTCKSIIGTEPDGRIKKVTVEPYEYTLPETGEIITLSHRYEFVSELDVLVNEPKPALALAS